LREETTIVVPETDTTTSMSGSSGNNATRAIPLEHATCTHD